jgi:aminoglycoside phosphotransferase (APT) family kinase protein
LGHPLADLAYNCIGYHMPDLGDKQFSLSSKDLQSWGIPNEKQYVAAYCRRTRRADIPDWNFYVAFGIFRLAAIVQGVYKRGLDGIASAANAREYGDMVRFLSDTAWQLVAKGKKPA